MSYFDILPLDVIIHIISKSTLESLLNLTSIVNIDDVRYKYLYSLNFKFIYDEYVKVFNLDDSITWKEHYIQMFKLHNLIRCCEECTSLSIVDDNMFLTLSSSHERDYIADELTLEVSAEVYGILRTKIKFHIPDYYLMRMIKSIKNDTSGVIYIINKSLLFDIWCYSKTYAEFILNQIDHIVYTSHVVGHYEYIDVYKDLTGENRRGPEKLRLDCIKKIVSTDSISRYGLSGSYFKYIFQHHQRIISDIALLYIIHHR